MAERRVLLSWKDISSYAGRGVRTIQRYEASLGFPVHRPSAKSRSSVLAFADEIDAWFRKAPLIRCSDNNPPPMLNESERRTCHAIAEKATHGRQMATITHAACTQQAERVRAMMQKFEKYQRPKAA